MRERERKQEKKNLFERDQSSGGLFPLSAAWFIVHNKTVWTITSVKNKDGDTMYRAHCHTCKKRKERKNSLVSKTRVETFF